MISYVICNPLSRPPGEARTHVSPPPAAFSIQGAGAVVIWILRRVAGVFVCTYGLDNLVTLLSSGAGFSLQASTAMRATFSTRNPPTTPPTTSPTAILRQPLMEEPWMHP